jgi:Ca2+-binding RTX toxin-like protein
MANVTGDKEYPQDVDDYVSPSESDGTDGKVTTNSSDTIHMKTGKDTVYAASGKDYIYGESGADTLYGQGGNDEMYGGSGADKMYGGGGADTMHGGGGADTMYGDDGADTMYGDDGADTMYGGGGADKMYGRGGADKMYGKGGADDFYLGKTEGGDTIYEFKDEDTIYLEGSHSSTNSVDPPSGKYHITNEPGNRWTVTWDNSGDGDIDYKMTVYGDNPAGDIA